MDDKDRHHPANPTPEGEAIAPPPSRRATAQRGLRTGIKKGRSSFIWIAEIVIPVSALVALLQWSGWLVKADFLLGPLMGLLHLPSEAALPIISSMAINLYAAIATMTVLPFTTGQMTLIAVFTLIAHNLIVEGIIQRRSGISIAKITLVRIGAAIITVLIVAQFLGDTSEGVAGAVTTAVRPPLVPALKAWGLDMAHLLIKVFAIIMGITTTLECSRAVGLLKPLPRFSEPLMAVLGLSNRTAMLWITAVIFGLMYGGAVIVEEARREGLTKEELERLHISVGINHSMVEDPSLFLVLGLNGFWLWIPKLIMAIIIVQAFRGAGKLRDRLHSGTKG